MSTEILLVLVGAAGVSILAAIVAGIATLIYMAQEREEK